MAIHTILTTKSLIDGTHNLTFQIGDEIITTGYYTENDGGGATFTVVAATENVTEYFEHLIAGTNLKAVLKITNGTINIDQLGAKGDAVIPDYPTNGINNGTELNEYADRFLTENLDIDFIDSLCITAALERNDISEIHLTAGKIYSVITQIDLSNLSDKTINGNGAGLLAYPDISMDRIFYGSNLDNITIKNLSMTLPLPYVYYPCIYFDLCKDVTIENVDFIFSGIGIQISDSSHLMLNNISFSHCFNGLYLTAVTNSVIKNIRYNSTMNVENAIYNPIYFDQGIKQCVFENIAVNGSGLVPTAVIFKANGNNYISGNTLSKFVIKDCKTALSLSFVKNTLASNIVASNVDTAVSADNALQVRLSECHFKSYETPNFDDNFTPIPFVEFRNGVCDNLYFDNTTFDVATTLFYVSDRKQNGSEIIGDDIVFTNCVFKVGNLSNNYVSPIAYIGNPISNIRFYGCNFSVKSFVRNPADENPELANIEQNTYIFYLHDNNAADNHWEFDNCYFSHSTVDSANKAVTVNSPILIDYEEESKTYVKLTNNTFKDFRWIMRIGSTADSSAVPYKNENNEVVLPNNNRINPAFNALPDSDIITAAENLFTAKKRYLAIDNLYVFDTIPTGATTHYKKAEEYGLSE